MYVCYLKPRERVVAGQPIWYRYSGASVCSLRLAGFPTIGFAGGNIKSSGTIALCSEYKETFKDIMKLIL